MNRRQVRIFTILNTQSSNSTSTAVTSAIENATIDQNSLTASPGFPTITGTAENVNKLLVNVVGADSTEPLVVNGRWSSLLIDDLKTGNLYNKCLCHRKCRQWPRQSSHDRNFDSKMKTYKPTIGLEIHAELKTRTKMFCDSKNDADETRPNVNVCPICMGHPGTLPVINKEAVRHVIRVGVSVGGKIADFTEFDRKNYFYPDIPKGYQISQYKYPLVSGGELNGVALTRVHLEEDTASSTHDTGIPPRRRINSRLLISIAPECLSWSS